jgi:hypothetical protein
MRLVFCRACQVPITVAKKEESKSEGVRFTTRSESVHHSRPNTLIRVTLRELTPGLRYHPIVFRFKDNLRI